MIDTGFLYAKDNNRVFINSCLGCTGGCIYCYLSKIGYDNKSKREVKKASIILKELDESGLKITENTLISLGCFSECWDEQNKPETLQLLRHFLKNGNQVQLSTKKEITAEEVEELQNLIKYSGQLVVFISSASISDWSRIEPNTDSPQKRFKTFDNLKNLDIPVVLYIKPILQDITIKDVDSYNEFIKTYGVKDVVVGSIFTERENVETVHFSNDNKLFYNPVSDEVSIMRNLMKFCRVYTRSSQVMQKYREKEFEER